MRPAGRGEREFGSTHPPRSDCTFLLPLTKFGNKKRRSLLDGWVEPKRECHKILSKMAWSLFSSSLHFLSLRPHSPHQLPSNQHKRCSHTRSARSPCSGPPSATSLPPLQDHRPFF